MKNNDIKIVITFTDTLVYFKLFKMYKGKFDKKLIIKKLPTLENINKIVRICKSNNFAIIHSKDNDSYIRKLCRIKLKYNDNIPVFY